MKNEDGCYIWLFLFTVIVFFLVKEHWEQVLVFLFCILLVVCVIFLIDYLHTLYLTNFSEKTKEIMSFSIDTNKIEKEINSIKNSTLKYYRGEKYYNLIERSNIFKNQS